jgi:predicted enzyme related to lactoylglutathione lyase
MAKVLGLGGVFFKAKDPAALIAWYNEHLGMSMNEYGAQLSIQALPPGAYNVFSPFKLDTQYFAPSDKPFMINLVVDDVAACLAKVAAAGAEVVNEIEKSEYGVFGWFIDPAGNKIELWEPPAPPN